MRNSWRAAFAALLILGPYGAARADTFTPDVTVTHDDIVYNVNADGTYTKDETETFRINTDQGVKHYGQIALRFSPSLQQLDIPEAYTTTKDGKRVDVAADDIKVQQSPESADAPMFDDNKVKVAVFPDVEIGASVTLREHRVQKVPLFPGQFAALEVFGANRTFEAAHLTIRAPANLPLHVDAIDLQGGQTQSDQSGQQVWQWSLGNTPAQAPELASVQTSDYSPRVAVTTFADFPAVGSAYLARAKSKAAVTPAIQALADKLTQGVTDPRAQAEVLYRWVSGHIRYVATYLGVGGIVPHDAQVILDADYGDCKDHATLLGALLAAKGIQSSPVLVNAEASYWLPKVATPWVFNHAITYLPAFNLFVDSTAEVAEFGVLPPLELGKQVVVADDGSGQSKLMTLPLSNPARDRVMVTTTMTLTPDGDLKGSSDIAGSGVFDLEARAIFASIPQSVEKQLGDYLLKQSGQDGSGSYTHGDIRDLAKPFDYASEFKLPGYAQFPGPGALRLPDGLNSFNSIAASFANFAPEARVYAMPWVNKHVTETITIKLPDDVKVPNLPKPAKITSPYINYESSYAANGQSIVVTRTLDIDMPTPLVQPDEYPALRKVALAVTRDLRTQLVY